VAKAYYNEIDQDCCDWLSNLMDAGLIAPGKIDNRSIADVNPDDLTGFQRVHFFAGIAGWELALQQAGWPAERPVWTGSCPCQSFSSAGKGGGINDHRHLWPEMFRLIESRQPETVFGEQVSGKRVTGKLFSSTAFRRLNQAAAKAARGQDQEAWLGVVQSDLEGANYALGSLTFPACGIGAPMLSQRLYWVAEADKNRRNQDREYISTAGGNGIIGDGTADQLGTAPAHWKRALDRQPGKGSRQEKQIRGSDFPRSVAPAGGEGSPKQQGRWDKSQGLAETGGSDRPAPTAGFWANPDWVYCQDGALRPAQPGYEPLAHGIPGKLEQMRTELQKLAPGAGNIKDLLRQCKKILRSARSCRNQQLKGYGNAIVTTQAVAFVEAYLEAEEE